MATATKELYKEINNGVYEKEEGQIAPIRFKNCCSVHGDVHDSVAVQNQTGSHPNRWDKTGVIIDKLPFPISMDGSR